MLENIIWLSLKKVPHCPIFPSILYHSVSRSWKVDLTIYTIMLYIENYVNKNTCGDQLKAQIY